MLERIAAELRPLSTPSYEEVPEPAENVRRRDGHGPNADVDETGRHEQVFEVRAVVAPKVAHGLVLEAPAVAAAGHSHEDEPAGPNACRHLPDEGLVICDVLDDEHAEHEVERRLGWRVIPEIARNDFVARGADERLQIPPRRLERGG